MAKGLSTVDDTRSYLKHAASSSFATKSARRVSNSQPFHHPALEISVLLAIPSLLNEGRKIASAQAHHCRVHFALQTQDLSIPDKRAMD